MADFFIYDMNNYLSLDSRLLTLSGLDSLPIYPAVGYEVDEAPIILWWYYPQIRSAELPWWRTDVVKYQVLDTDAARCIAMGERIIQILNVSDDARQLVASPSYHGKWIFMARGDFEGPAEREGWYKYTIEFNTSYLPI